MWLTAACPYASSGAVAWLLGRSIAPIWWDVYSTLLLKAHTRPSLLRVLSSLERRNNESKLSQATVRLYGRTLREPAKAGLNAIGPFPLPPG